MKNKFIVLMSMLFCMLFSFAAFGFDVPPAPANGGYVVDQSGRLSATDIQTINTRIEAINKSTKNEIGVLMIKSVGDDSIEDIAYKTFNTWGIGKKGLDNGVLLVIAVESKKARIETGKGVGGEITDIQAHDIIINKMKPQFRAGNMLGCVIDSVDAVSSILESRKNQAAETPKVSSSEDGFGIFLLVLVGFFGLIGVGVWLISRGDRKKEELHNENKAYRYNYDNTNDNVTNAATGALVGGVVGMAAGAIYESEHKKHAPKKEKSSSYSPSSSSSYDSYSPSSSSSSSSSDWGSSSSSSSDFGGFDWGSSGGGGGTGDL